METDEAEPEPAAPIPVFPKGMTLNKEVGHFI